MFVDSGFDQEVVDDEIVTLSASHMRNLFGRIFASAGDDIVFDIPRPVLDRLYAAAKDWNTVWVEDVSMTALWADGHEASVFEIAPSLFEDFRALRAAKLKGPLVF